jgi:hypothetical protein
LIAVRLCAGPLAAQAQALAPLPEEAKCRARTVVWEQTLACKTRVGDGIVGMVHAKIERAELDGAPHLLVHAVGLAPDPATGLLKKLEEHSLWDAEARLVRLRVSLEPGAWQEAAWEKDGVLLRDSKAPKAEPKVLACSTRPSASEDVLIHVKKLRAEEPLQAVVIDQETMKPYDLSLQLAGEQELTRGAEKVPVRTFVAKGKREVTTHVGSDGRIEQSEVKDVPIVMVRALVPDREVQRAILSNPMLLAPTLTRLRASWKEAAGEWRSEALGIALKLPAKGWKRQATTETNAVFMAMHESNDSLFLIAVEPTGDAWTLDEYGDALGTAKAQIQGASGKPAKSEAKLLGRKAVLLDYQASPAGAVLQYVTSVTLLNGFAVQATTVTTATKYKAFKPDLDAIGKGLRPLAR